MEDASVLERSSLDEIAPPSVTVQERVVQEDMLLNIKYKVIICLLLLLSNTVTHGDDVDQSYVPYIIRHLWKIHFIETKIWNL